MRWRICVESAVNSQSSMNSHRWKSELSFVSGIASTSSRIESTIAFLNSKPPSSRRKLARKPTSTRCFSQVLEAELADRRHTTTILNSSAISFMNVEICFISRSTEPSEPVLSSVVIASVAIGGSSRR